MNYIEKIEGSGFECQAGNLTLSDDWKMLKNAHKDLREQLLLSQKREMDLREALQHLVGFNLKIRLSMRLAEKLLSTPPTLDDLNAWRDAEIEKALGEPVGEIVLSKEPEWIIPHETVVWHKTEFELGTKFYAIRKENK
jgi:hypothetical protein